MLRARLTRADRWAIAVLIVVPILLNVPWALAGHPVLDGDNLTQNYPLRVYAGQLLSHGRLPLWDSGIWSGVPLLAGWNAGAMFPGTWLFAFFSGVSAYEIDIVATGIVCGVGLLLFLRRQRCSPLASFLGALAFSEMGFVSGQQAHLGLVEGTALVPWMLLAVDGIWRTANARAEDDAGSAGLPAMRATAGTLASAGHWIALLGVTLGLAALAGDPRAVSSDAITAGIFLGACCWRSRHEIIPIIAAAAAGAALGVAIGAAQWLPGLSYLHASQRAGGGSTFFGFGSLGWGSLPLLVTPYLAGGNGNLGMPDYIGPLNTPEVTFAVGILPVIALFALLPRLRRHERIGVWYVMFIVGALLTAGTKTPLGDLLARIPLYGGQRLQNRNTAISDLALCSLLAVFVDTLRPAAAEGRRRAERWLGALPVIAATGLVVAMFVWTGEMEHFLGATRPAPHLPTDMWPYYTATGVVCAGALVVVLRRRWSPSDRQRRTAAAVVIADVVLFTVMASYQPIPSAALAPTNQPLATLRSALPPGARFAIDDPNQLALDSPQFLADELGVDDLNLLHVPLPSVQGYGSAVPAAYEIATGTHDVENLLPAAFTGPIYDELDLGLVVVVPDQFGRIVPPGSSVPIPPGPPLQLGASLGDRQPGAVARASYPPAGPWRLGAGGNSPITWELPAPTSLSQVTIHFEARYGPLPPSSVVTLTLADGLVVTEGAHLSGTTATAVVPPSALTGGGGVLTVAVSVPPSEVAGAGAGVAARPVVGAVSVRADSASAPLALHQPSAGTVDYALDGLMQGLLAPPAWQYAGRTGPLVLYRNTAVRGPAWLETPASTSPAAGVAPGAVATPTVSSWQDPVNIVHSAAPVLLVRSEQFAPGWSAAIQPLDAAGRPVGPASPRQVLSVGLIQGVELPAGHFLVTWRYTSARAELGLVAAGLGCVGCVGFGLVGLRSRQRRGHKPPVRRG